LLLRAWCKYGEQSFTFEILEEVSNPDHLLAYEQVYLDYYKSYEEDRGYNICKVAGSQYGLKRTEETKRKISDAVSGENAPFRGKKHKPETIEYLRKINTGKAVSEETKQKLREKLSGVNAPNYGKKFSEETRAKIGKASSERRHTEETKRKMREKRTGRRHDQETLNKMSKFQRERHKNNKGYTFDKDKNKYRVKLWINGAKKHIGYYKTEEEAKQVVSDATINPAKYISDEANRKRKLSQETKDKISQRRKGTKLSEEHKKKIGEASCGRKHSEEAKRKISEANKGRKHTEEAKQKIREARNKTLENSKGGI
jgi:hypothetical protein